MEIYVYTFISIIVIAAIIVLKEKIIAILPFFKKGNVYQNNICGNNNNTTMANGDNVSATSITINGNVTFQKHTHEIEQLTEEDRNKLIKWVNSTNPLFNRTDNTMFVRFTLGANNDYNFNAKTEKNKISSMESCLVRMEKNGYIEKDENKTTKHKWYKLTDKAYNEFINN